MSTITYLTSLVQQAIGRLNNYEANAKKVDELPHQTTLEPTSKIPVSRAGISEHLTVQQIISSIQNSNYNQLLAVGTISVSGTDITVPSGVSGQINGLLYGTSTDTILSITLCPTGFSRKDIIVLTTANTVVVISGEETDGSIVLAPPVPTDAVYITEFDVNDTTIGAPIDPSVGTQFKKKDESRRFTETLTGADQVIELRAAGQTNVSVIGTGLTSIAGFSTALITSNPTADPLYTGKDVLFSNDTDAPVTLKNEFSGVDVAFKFGADLVVPIGGKVWMKYYSSGIELVMKSWSEDSSVLEFANLAAFPVTGETKKIYIDLSTNLQYRWSGSAYVQIGGSTQGKDFTYRAWIPLGHVSTTISTIGTQTLTINGTLSADTYITSPATKFNKIKKLSAVSAGTAGSSSGWRNAGVYTASLELETEWEQSFYFGDTSVTEVTDKRVFVGFRQLLTAITNVDPSTLGSAFGMACDGTDVNYQFMYKFNGIGLTKIDLGISKAGAGVDFFHLKIFKNANERIINYYVKNIITGVEVSGNVSYLSDDIMYYVEHIHINNNTTASPVRIGFGEISMKNYY